MCNLCVCSSGIAAQGGTSDVIQVYQNGSSTLSVWVGDAPYDELHALRGVSMERNGLGRGHRSGVKLGGQRTSINLWVRGRGSESM